MTTQPSESGRFYLAARTGDQTIARFELADRAEHVLGASSQADWKVTSERFLSRRHVHLRRTGDRVEIERVSTASNPVLVRGASIEHCTLSAGDFFVIGSTIFQIESADAPTGAEIPSGQERGPSKQFTLGAEDLRIHGDATDRLRLLDLLKLPEILRTRSRKDFFLYACGALRMATGALWVQVLAVEDGAERLLCEDAGLDRMPARVHSESLVKEALEKAPQPVTFCWQQDTQADLQATAHEGIEWAVCCAMPIPGEKPILLYLAGARRDEPGAFASVSESSLGLRDTARLVGLVADTVGRAVAVQKLEDWQVKLSHFFSGKLASKILESDDPRELAPRIRQATVMFFDIRGFSLLTEGNVQRILEHQGELKRVLTAMTQCIFDHDGVVIRYMGDGILACWNVPYDLGNHVERACLSALRMVELLAETSGWTCGIGIGMGEVVAGSLGSEQVYAYDILGPVVNQAARVEGITKEVSVPILVTEDIACAVSPERLLCRRVARFLPLGMETELDLYTIETTPSDRPRRQAIVDRHAIHAQALTAFETGEWEKAFDLLHPIVREDAAARYVYTLALQRHPPRDWRGVVEMKTK